MSQQFFLTSLLQRHKKERMSLTPFDEFIRTFLEGISPERDLVERLIMLPDLHKQSSAWLLMDRWQETLVILILLSENGLLSLYRGLLVERVRLLNTYFLWQEFQLIATYRALCARLLDRQEMELPIHQMASGACPLEWSGRWSWGGIPHARFHAELGILWCIFGQICQSDHYIKAAERLAEWQLNTLDYDYLPFAGLFSQEGDAPRSRILINNYLLFRIVSKLTGRGDLAFVAEKQRDALNQLMIESPYSIPYLAVALEQWIETRHGGATAQNLSLPSTFKDTSLLLMGCRSKDISSIATLSGGGSGLGCYHYGDIKIVNYGPQHLPLGDCRGFGIETHKERLSRCQIYSSEAGGSFRIEGSTRMTPQPKLMGSNATYRNGTHSGIWMDVNQKFEDRKLSLEIKFRGLHELSSMAFAFFVKAKSCLVDSRQMIRPRSFERYQGDVHSIQLLGDRGSLSISPLKNRGGMQVIPLGGGDNFWGADFLVAYLVEVNQPDCSWCVQ